MEFTDISSEEFRTYTFPGGEKITIEKPQALHVSPSGGHRVSDVEGRGHYVPVGWIHLTWTPRKGAPTFVL